MSYPANKTRVSFALFCEQLARHGFHICHLSQYEVRQTLHLRLVVMNRGNLAVQVEGQVAPPHWGEDLFYKLLSQVELFGVN